MNKLWRSSLSGRLLVLFLILILAGCGSAAPETTGVNNQATAPTEVPAITPTAVADQSTKTTGFPVTIENCDRKVTFDAPPQRVVVNDVNILELFLALDLQDRLVGYSSVRVDKEIAPEYQAKLEGIPLLAERYPGIEVLAGAEPDFYLAGWNYGLSEESGLTPDSLAALGIQTYAITESCIRVMPREQVSLEDTFTDLLNLGKIFGVEERAQALVDHYRAELAEIKATIGQVNTPLRVFVYDSGEDTPLTAARFATPNAMIEAAGGTNIFNDVQSSWTRINWEDVIERNPAYIVIIDYGQPDAQGKIDFLKSRAELAAVEAIQNNKFVVLTYAEATPGPRNVASTRRLAEAFYPEKFENTTTTTSITEIHTTAFPLTIENCGLTYTYEAPPQRAVTMNQASTEIMLALGLEESMVGTAYLDDEILPALDAAYRSVPILAEKYPSQEVLFASEPDFVYGAYRSAFGDEAAGSRTKLAELGINSYLSTAACEDEALRPSQVTLETVYAEIRDIAAIFGVPERGEALINGMQTRLEAVTAAIGSEVEPVTIFWYDSGTDDVYAGACCGIPGEIIQQVGAENIFADVKGSWATVNWEEVISRNPDVIVIIEADWSPAAEKIELLTSNPAYAAMTAVQEKRFIVVPFSATTPGIRNLDAVEELAHGLYPDKFE